MPLMYTYNADGLRMTKTVNNSSTEAFTWDTNISNGVPQSGSKTAPPTTCMGPTASRSNKSSAAQASTTSTTSKAPPEP